MTEKLEITLEKVKKNIDDYILLDMRDAVSYRNGHIDGALLYKDFDLSDIKVDKIPVLYCEYGEKSLAEAEKLSSEGINVLSLKDGFKSWLASCFTILEKKELERYDRQMILPQIGLEGQEKLKKASVLIVGAGGLGSPAALYAAAAGIGNIGIIDGDTVCLHNLQRQILHSTERIGKNKSESAKETLEALNDNITVKSFPFYLTKDNAVEIINKYDLVIDCTDSTDLKLLINDICVELRKPFIYGGASGLTGQVMTCIPGKTPCLRCIFEDVPPDNGCFSCETAGILGAVCGITGSVQALEAVKYFTMPSDEPVGKMFIIDGASLRTRCMSLKKRNSSCKVCGKDH